jgi:hypothetical protein
MLRIRLAPKTRLWINFVGIGIWTTGLGWLIAHFLLNAQDPLGFANSSLEPLWLKAHGAFAFLALWTGGMLWGVHILRAWDSRRRRWSGTAVFSALLILIVTGYLLYYVADDGARGVISWAHWVLGLALPLAYLAHRLAKKAIPTRAR